VKGAKVLAGGFFLRPKMWKAWQVRNLVRNHQPRLCDGHGEWSLQLYVVSQCISHRSIRLRNAI